MRFSTHEHDVEIDERVFAALCHLLAGPEARVPELEVSDEMSEDKHTFLIAEFMREEHRIRLFRPGFEFWFVRFPDSAEAAGSVMAHELAHFIFLTYPDGSFVCRLHNGAQRLAERLEYIVPAWILKFIISFREYAANRKAAEFLRRHPEKFKRLVTVTEK
ncbi:MAG TPA: hypothetical protein VD862_03350 [Candidatus Paceibacterota bacterium]|nr:hypothetical protein [Candidatus Paceibacterota bacterium]